MKPVELILAAAGLQPVERTPVVAVLLQQGSFELGISLKEYFQKPDRLAEGQTRLIDHYENDAVFAIPHVVQDVLPWGTGIHFHDDGPPSVNRMVIKNVNDIRHLKIPDPTTHPYLKHSLACAEQLARTFKGDRLIVGAQIGPYSLPSMLMGMGKALKLATMPTPEQRELWPMMLSKTMAYCTRWAQALFDAGCDLVVIAEGMASASIITEQTFTHQAFHILKKYIETSKGLIGLELVGDAEPFAYHLKDLPAAAFLVGSNDSLSGMRNAIPDKAFLGNINNLKMIHWDPDRIEFEARKAIHEAGPGFILGNQGPEIPLHVPPENIKALIRAAHAETVTSNIAGTS